MPQEIFYEKNSAPLFIIHQDLVNHSDGDINNWDNVILRKLKEYTHNSDKMKWTRHISDFEFIPQDDRAISLCEMRKYVATEVTETIKEAEKKFGRIDRIGMTISSDNANWSLSLPISPLTENCWEPLLDRFRKVNIVRITKKMFYSFRKQSFHCLKIVLKYRFLL